MDKQEEGSPQVSARMGRDVIKARLWVQVDGAPDHVALILERVAAVFARPSEPSPDDAEPFEQHYQAQTGVPDEIKI